MATAVKVKKIVEILVNDDLNISEVEVDSMPVGVYVLSRARGVYKFARSEEARDAFCAREEAAVKKAVEARKAAQEAKRRAEEEAAKKVAEEEAAKKAAQEEATPEEEVAPEEVTPVEEATPEEVTPVEEVAPEEEVTPVEEDKTQKVAEKYGLVELKPNTDLRIFISDKGEIFFALSDGFISASPMTSETGDAFLGEKPLCRKSPKNYSVLLDKVGAMMPIESQYDELASLLVRATGSSTIEGFNKVCPFISLNNQLCTVNGKYKTYRGEYQSLLENFPVFNLECRKFISFKK